VSTLAHADPLEACNRRGARLAGVSETKERRQLWGGETEKALANLVSGEQMPLPVVHWLGRIKAAAARVNAELGLLDSDKAERIAAAGEAVAHGEHDDQFPLDVFQTGSGTSSNTNANEVIARLAGDDVHPNDDVNMGQSSNDVFPSAVHLAALDEFVHDLRPALSTLASSLERKAGEFDDVVKSGRTHMMDAVPVTLGQEFGGYAAQIRQGIARIEGALPRVGQIPLGGTAAGTGLNTHPEFAHRVRALLAEDSGLVVSAPADPFEAQAARDALVEASGALKVLAVSLTKIANDLRLMGSGPRAGLAEIRLPELQKGSSIMPGKVNPVIAEVVTQVSAQVIGNDTAITIGGMSGQFELNVYVPLIARNLLQSIALLASASRLLADRCVDGIEANREQLERYAELTLSAAAALNPYIGYDKGTEIVKEAAATGRSLREVARDAGVDETILDKALDYRALAKPHD
jgi:fumarate hydratase class II